MLVVEYFNLSGLTIQSLVRLATVILHLCLLLIPTLMMLARVQQPKSLLKQIAMGSHLIPSIEAQSTEHLRLGTAR